MDTLRMLKRRRSSTLLDWRDLLYPLLPLSLPRHSCSEALFPPPDTAATAPSQAQASPGRPRQPRRRSLRHVSSDPILYHHHARAPSYRKPKQAFGPLDIKPYGYRVGVEEVRAIFGHSEETPAEEPKQSMWDFAFLQTAMMMEGEMVTSASGCRGTATFVTHVKSPKSPSKKPLEPATPAMVALQRYPIIPYHPPGPG